jgi:hypothetical protein
MMPNKIQKQKKTKKTKSQPSLNRVQEEDDD